MHLQPVVNRWADSMSNVLNEVLGWNAKPIIRDGSLEQLVIDSWLESYPDADIAVTNKGGVRADLESGDVTFSSVFNILPFDNNIIVVEVNGSAIMNALPEGGRPVLAGLKKSGEERVLTRINEKLHPEKNYILLLNSFMYAGGDNFGAIARANPNGFDTGMNYRQPFVNWIRRQDSTQNNPLHY
jgi:5'-nucleotidase/UDP-sugar diphosphatase